jgi:hypothetical protein
MEKVPVIMPTKADRLLFSCAQGDDKSNSLQQIKDKITEYIVL